MVDVFAVGSALRIKGSDLRGIVTAICVRGTGGEHITYEVSWVFANGHNCKWLDACEVEPVGEFERVAIGFTDKLLNAMKVS